MPPEGRSLELTKANVRIELRTQKNDEAKKKQAEEDLSFLVPILIFTDLIPSN